MIGRKIVTVLVGLGLLLLVAVASSMMLPGHAVKAQDELQKAAADLSKTEQHIVDKAGQGQRLAEQMKKDVAGSNQSGQAAADVAKYLKELQRKNEDLQACQQQLEADIGSFETARHAKLAELDNNIAAIRDPLLRRQMQRIRDRLARDSNKSLSLAKVALSQLAGVLERGGDLERVSNVFRASAEFSAAIGDLQTQAQQVNAFASDYSDQANALMAVLASSGSQVASD
jgi:hypothetical protein